MCSCPRVVPGGARRRPPLVAALTALRLFLHNRAEHAAVRQVAEQLLYVAGCQNTRDARLMAHHGYRLNLLFRGEFSGALQYLTEAAAIDNGPAHGALTLAPIDPGVAFVSWACCFRVTRIRRLGQADKRSPTREGRLHTLAYALHVNCVFHQLCRDGAMLRERAEELVALATDKASSISWDQGPASGHGPCSRWEDPSRRPSAECGPVWRRSNRRVPSSRCLIVSVFSRKRIGEQIELPTE